MLNLWSKRLEIGTVLPRQSVVRWLAFSFLSVLLAMGASVSHGRTPSPDDALATISVAELPKQGQRVYELIGSGGPFSYEKDGVVFGNRERLLPAHKRGYYREYTVKTSGARNRGARRIVCGGYEVQRPDACYYSDDHYASFRKIVN